MVNVIVALAFLTYGCSATISQHPRNDRGPYIKREFVNKTTTITESIRQTSISTQGSKSLSVPRSTDTLTASLSLVFEISPKPEHGEQSRSMTASRNTNKVSYPESWATDTAHGTASDGVGVTPLSPASQTKDDKAQSATYVRNRPLSSQSGSIQFSKQSARSLIRQTPLDPSPSTSIVTVPILPETHRTISDRRLVTGPPASTSTHEAVRATGVQTSEGISSREWNATQAPISRTTAHGRETMTASISPSLALPPQRTDSMSSLTFSALFASEIAPSQSLPSPQKVAQEMLMENHAASNPTPPLPSNPFPSIAVGQAPRSSAIHSDTSSVSATRHSSVRSLEWSSITLKSRLDSTLEPKLTANSPESPTTGGSMLVTFTSTGSLQSDASASNTAEGESPKQKATKAGIAMGAVGLGLLCGATTFIVVKRYRHRLRPYQRFTSVRSSRSSLEIRCAGLMTTATDAMATRDRDSSHHPSSPPLCPASVHSAASRMRSPRISGPLDVEHSLGWR